MDLESEENDGRGGYEGTTATYVQNSSDDTDDSDAKDDKGGLLAFLSWKDLTLKVNSSKTILHGLSGYAEPTRLVAIMGPSGSGKTSLLSTLSGRASNGAVVTGQIILNGRKAEITYGSGVAYLAQDVSLLGTLTVYETLYYSAKLRFPNSVKDTETQKIVTKAIQDVGLQDSENTRIGNWYQRGISGGEKRRVSIAMELLTSPYLLFLDEPTTGLDSASSFHVIKTLKALAEDGSRTVLCSIHQPSSEVFELFDDLCLLSDGRQVYSGPLPQALQFFERNGFPCPPVRSRSDHYLHCVNSDFDKVERILDKQGSFTGNKSSGRYPQMTGDKVPRAAMNAKQVVDLLAESYRTSEEKKHVDDQVERISHMEDTSFKDNNLHASFVRQCIYLTIRSFINMHRDFGYYWLRSVMYIVLAISIGTIFNDLGRAYSTIQDRSACLCFFVAFLSFMAVGGFPSFVEDMKVFATERMNGHYRVGAFVVGNSLSSLPFIFMISSVSSVIVYPAIKFHGGFEHIVFFVLNLFGCLVAAEAMLMAVASVVSNFLLGIILGAGVQGVFILVSGYFRLANEIPEPVWKFPIFYISYIGYAFQGFMHNEFKDKTFDGYYPTDPDVTGHFIVDQIYQIQNRSKWVNLAIVWGIAAIYRSAQFCLLQSREKLLPALMYQTTKRVKALGLLRPRSPSNSAIVVHE